MKVEDLGQLSEGNANEVEDMCVRIYDKNGYPRIELWVLLDEYGNPLESADDIQELAEDIRSIINFTINERIKQ